MLKFLILGFIIQLVTSIDDMFARVPISASLTKTHRGKIAFSIGNIIAVSLAVTIAFLFSSAIQLIPYFRFILTGLLILLAYLVYSELLKQFIHVGPAKPLMSRISNARFLKLVAIGFVVSFIMIIISLVGTQLLPPKFPHRLTPSLAHLITFFNLR